MQAAKEVEEDEMEEEEPQISKEGLFRDDAVKSGGERFLGEQGSERDKSRAQKETKAGLRKRQKQSRDTHTKITAKQQEEKE